MKLYFSLTKKTLVVITTAFCLFVFVFGRFTAAKNIYKNGDTNAKRVYYIDVMGFAVNEEAVSYKEIKITEKIASTYYVKGYIGCDALLYRYNTVMAENQIDLVVYNGRIIGAGVASGV